MGVGPHAVVRSTKAGESVRRLPTHPYRQDPHALAAWENQFACYPRDSLPKKDPHGFIPWVNQFACYPPTYTKDPHALVAWVNQFAGYSPDHEGEERKGEAPL